MSYSKLILRDSADIVWPLDDITESSSVSKAINFFNSNPNSFSASINPDATELVYNPIVFGGGTLLSFSSSTIGLSIPALGRFSEIYNGRDSAFSIWFQTNKLSNTEQVIFKKRNFENIGLFIKDNYLIFRYGTSASYTEVVQDFVDAYEPMHIFIGKNQSTIFLSINSNIVSKPLSDIELNKDDSHSDNDYIDFYGPINNNWYIDSPTFYPNILNQSVLKRHYVYGLGKNINDNIFYSRGGNLYNFSTIDTKKLSLINWRYPQDWNLSSIENLISNNEGIQPPKFGAPSLVSIDNNINTASNFIKFTSSSFTQASYIEINKLYSKWSSAENPIFIKLKLDGQLPDAYLSQRLISYGLPPNYEVVSFDLFNDNGSYKIVISSPGNSASTSFNINNISASPDIYLGMKFSSKSMFYFAESGSAIQSSSFIYLSASSNVIDPLTPYFPPPTESVIRIGSSLGYDLSNYTNNVYNIKQFYGSVKRFLIARQDIDISQNFSYLDSYNKSIYESVYDSSLERFRIKSYGYGQFLIHAINFSEYISDTEIKIGGNVINFGYPFVESSSQVLFYTTILNYSGSTVYPKTRLLQNNYVPFINNTNLQDKYMQFDFEIYSEDLAFYPPKIKYFNMETYKGIDNKVALSDDSGIKYYVNQSASSIYLPEIRQTPSIFMSKNSGLKLLNTTADFSENILAKPLDPRILGGLVLWIDARFINGFNKNNYLDDSIINSVTDLSFNNNAIYQNDSASAPVFRIQARNLLKVNQSTGSEDGDLSNILFINSIGESSPEGTVSGQRGIKITPNGNIDSYLSVSSNSSSITLYPSQEYLVLGSIKLLKPQTASFLHNYARSICIVTNNGSASSIYAISASSLNQVGTYSLSAVFTTASNLVSADVRFYNGSYLTSDSVYWDNLGVFPVTSSAISWSNPLTENDRSSIMFNGKSFLNTSASTSNNFTIYALVRSFGNGNILSGSYNILYSSNNNYYFNNGVTASFSILNNDFNIITISSNADSASFYFNSNFITCKNIGNNYLNIEKIGNHLMGDITTLLIYNDTHYVNNISLINNWISESFNI